MQNFFFNDLLLKIEGRLGKNLSAFIITFILMIFAAIYVRPAITCVVHGLSYGALSNNPLSDFNNPMAFRILPSVALTISVFL